jgi:hypothetical protein
VLQTLLLHLFEQGGRPQLGTIWWPVPIQLVSLRLALRY